MQADAEAQSSAACKTTTKRVCKTVKLHHPTRSKKECHNVKVVTCPKPQPGAPANSDATCINIINSVVRIGDAAVADCTASKQSAIAQQAMCQQTGCGVNPCAHFLQDVQAYGQVFQNEYDVLAREVGRCASTYTAEFDKLAGQLEQADAACNGAYTSVCG